MDWWILVLVWLAGSPPLAVLTGRLLARRTSSRL